eukprot:TRINITY_DN106884_c0_g1_i1.p1 TRINITY_DN106884_c0_g1~~TRINITY_DN106884_c0_g1_i1.p1  ORF type:complete len:192 (-),score=35.34 TRINITY_DN106884_c0_g1_i1:22-597(-)
MALFMKLTAKKSTKTMKSLRAMKSTSVNGKKSTKQASTRKSKAMKRKAMKKPKAMKTKAVMKVVTKKIPSEKDEVNYVMLNGKRAVAKRDSGTDWKLFTPKVIHKDRCLARTWNNERGGQCENSVDPETGGDLCDGHRVWGLVHGKVTGPIPEAKLREFEYWAAVRARREAKRKAASPRSPRGSSASSGSH